VNLDFLGNLERTHKCGALRSTGAGETVTLMGWVNRRRDHGNLIFLDVRDRTGITQIVFDKEASPEAHAKAEAARPEYVVAATGRVRVRGEGLANPNMPTGEIEVVASQLLLLNDAKTPPFPIAAETGPAGPITNDEVRLKYRYLDLRRPELQRNFELRHKVTRAIRDYLSDNEFLEIETPLLTRSTPEGARDYLVPSRVHPGHFYALPQSPQIFKQILMIAGFDRYFQVARCFRDEDLRADRQPDFTQIDLEMTFPKQETVFRIVEGFLRAAFAAGRVTLEEGNFVQMTYDDAIHRYGIDKPDMRLPAIVDVSSAFTENDRETLKISKRHPVLAVVIPEADPIEDPNQDADVPLNGTQKRKFREELAKLIQPKPVAQLDLDRLRKAPQFVPLYEKIDKLCARELGCARCEPENQMFVFNGIEDTPEVWGNDRLWFYKLIGLLRLEIAKRLANFHRRFLVTEFASMKFDFGGLEAPPVSPELSRKAFKFLWVTDFPMYEWNEEHKRWDAAHHPFTSPHEDDITSGRLVSDKGAVRALAYDIVLNGTELGSGSIRIHRQDVQAEIFRSLGMSDEEAQARFGFFLNALEYGTPPHGGIALGLDRIVMILAGATSLREVIAFPKTAKAIDLMVDAPTPVSDQQLRDLNLRIVTRS